jgi:hypothetical protein
MKIRRIVPALALALAALAGPASVAAAQTGRIVLDPAALAGRTGGAEDTAGRVRSLAKSGRPAEAVAQARAALADPATGLAERERLRYDTLMALAGAEPDASARGFVAESKAFEPRVFMRIDESGHEIVVPAWDAAAAARYAERRWVARDARGATLEILARRGDVGAEWAGADAAARTGMLEALAEAPVAQLAGPAADLSARLAAGPELAEPALVVARRTQDASLFAAALLAAPDLEATRAMRDGIGAFAAHDRVGIYAAALDRDSLASAALLGLAAEAPTDPRAESLLWDALSRPDHAPSAAAALARLDTPGLVPRLETLARDGGEPSARWARFALELKRQGGAR